MSKIHILYTPNVTRAPTVRTYPSFKNFADDLAIPKVVSNKLDAGAFLPVTLIDNPRLTPTGEIAKVDANIATVNLLALDFDCISAAQLDTVLACKLDNVRWVAHTTFRNEEERKQSGNERWRVWVELSEPVPAAQWKEFRARFDAYLEASVDHTTTNPARMMFEPCIPKDSSIDDYGYFVWHSGDDSQKDAGTLDVKAVAAMPLPSHANVPVNSSESEIPADYEEPTGPLDLDEVKKLAKRLRKSEVPLEQKHGAWLQLLLKRTSFLSEDTQTHAPTLELARLLSNEFPLVSAFSLGQFVGQGLRVMALLRGGKSPETEESFVAMVKDWRVKKAVEAAPIRGLATPGKMTSVGGETDQIMAILNERFAVYRFPEGLTWIYEVTAGDVCTLLLNEEPLVQALIDAMPFDEEGKQMTERRAINKIAEWRYKGRKFNDVPAPSHFLSEPGPCYQRLPFDIAPGPTSAWDQFTARLTCEDSFRAFIWKGFEPKNEGRQILWIQGGGQDGKSTILDTIAHALGKSATAASARTFTARFGLSSLDGKRFAFVGDCQNTKLLMEETLRNVTSGDEVFVERKGEDGISKKLKIKMIVNSNYAPDISSARRDMSRLLFMEIEESKDKDDPQWKVQLAEQMPGFLFKCREAYERLCPHHGNLPMNSKLAPLVAERALDYETEFAEMLDTCFIRGGEEDFAPASPVWRHCTSTSLNTRWTNRKFSDFIAYLARNGIKSVWRHAKKRYFTNVKPCLRDDTPTAQLHSIRGSK